MKIFIANCSTVHMQPLCLSLTLRRKVKRGLGVGPQVRSGPPLSLTPRVGRVVLVVVAATAKAAVDCLGWGD